MEHVVQQGLDICHELSWQCMIPDFREHIFELNLVVLVHPEDIVDDRHDTFTDTHRLLELTF